MHIGSSPTVAMLYNSSVILECDGSEGCVYPNPGKGEVCPGCGVIGKVRLLNEGHIDSSEHWVN